MKNPTSYPIKPQTDVSGLLEQRACLVCGRTWNSLKSSEQAFCSRPCQYEMNGRPEGKMTWQELNSAFYAESKWTASERRKNGKTQHSAPPKPSAVAPPTEHESTRSALAARDITRSTKMNVTLAEPQTLGRVERENATKPENTTPRTVQEFESKSTPPGNAAIQHTDSRELSTSLNAGISDSMNLLSDSAKHLFGLMKSLAPLPAEGSSTDQFVKTMDPDRVKAAAECGKQLISAVRTQVDLLRLAKEVRDSK